MGEANGTFGVLETVRCLECGTVYAKPGGGGTVQTNPGCPSCGYVGWIPVGGPARRGPRRAAAAQSPSRPAGRG